MSDDHLESSPKIELSKPVLEGMDWQNDDLFFTHSFEDETSMFDPEGRWCYGGEYYSRTFYCRIPIAFRDCYVMIDNFLTMMLDNYPDEEGFWVNAKDSPV